MLCRVREGVRVEVVREEGAVCRVREGYVECRIRGEVKGSTTKECGQLFPVFSVCVCVRVCVCVCVCTDTCLLKQGWNTGYSQTTSTKCTGD